MLPTWRELTQAIDSCTSQFLETIEVPDLSELFENLRGISEEQVARQVIVFLDVLAEQDAQLPVVKVRKAFGFTGFRWVLETEELVI